VIVHDYQLSLAIGKEGQNARLAARLTGWHIDIKSESEAAAEEHYAEGDWAEGEWIEQSGEMVWKPAEGGETLSAEAWAAGGSGEEDAADRLAEAIVGEAEEAAAELVAEAVELAEEIVVEAVEAASEIELDAAIEAEAAIEDAEPVSASGQSEPEDKQVS
jgi:hypothetical protein